MKILLFKTNIGKASDRKVLDQSLKQYKGISKWNVDFGSKDGVLSVHCYGITAKQIIKSVAEAGFKCKEL